MFHTGTGGIDLIRHLTESATKAPMLLVSNFEDAQAQAEAAQAAKAQEAALKLAAAQEAQGAVARVAGVAQPHDVVARRAQPREVADLGQELAGAGAPRRECAPSTIRWWRRRERGGAREEQAPRRRRAHGSPTHYDSVSTSVILAQPWPLLLG